MNTILQAIQHTVGRIPMPFLEVWGLLAYIAGFAIAIFAFAGFTFRPGGRWGLGRERQAWDTTAVLSIPLTFVLVVTAGYLGSFIILVPGAQTLESLKDLMVFITILLFGYPALITIPFAYGLADLIEGVPPEFVLEWLPGYFINPTCFWLAYQLIGREPDFRKLKTWAWYAIFVLLFLTIEPILWGYICSDRFTAAVSYHAITPALFFTTGLTWLMAPLAMLGAYPLARRFRLFWAEIPGHVRERFLYQRQWTWEAGRQVPRERAPVDAWPLQLAIVAPFSVLILISVGATAFVSLHGAREDAKKLALNLMQETTDRLTANLSRSARENKMPPLGAEIDAFLAAQPIANYGIAMVLDEKMQLLGSSSTPMIPMLERARKALENEQGKAPDAQRFSFGFEVVSEKPLAYETWLASAASYKGPDRRNWRVMTAMPESYYLSGVKAGNSRSALMFALALLTAIFAAALLSGIVTRRLRRLSLATLELARGDLTQQVEGSRIEELAFLAQSFNDMAGRLRLSFEKLSTEIKQRGKVEDALNRLNLSLEQRVMDRTTELAQALVRAEAADRTKSAFLATMSHELRTPLNSIIGFTGLVLQGLAGPLSPEQAKQLGIVSHNAKHLLELINDVLDISKIEAEQLQLYVQSVEPRSLIEKALASIGSLAARKGLIAEAKIDPGLGNILTDPRRLEQILLNLLQNAVKFTENGKITLTAQMLDSTDAKDSRLFLSVADTGIGMKKEDLSLIFKPFQQLSNSLARQYEGTGLGLAISYRLAKLLGGELSVQSEWGKGSTFTLALPTSPPP